MISTTEQTSLTGLYLLIAELLRKELDSELIGVLSQPEIEAVFVQIEPKCQDYLRQDWTAARYELAAVEFCDLFILAEATCSPRAAAWLEIGGELTAESIDAVVQHFISQWGIELPENYRHLAYDHLSLVLYLYTVILEQNKELADEYFVTLLDPWLSEFAKALSRADSPVYSAVGQMLTELGHKMS